jgi:hypothetical protein
MRKVSFSTSDGKITGAAITVSYQGEEFERATVEVQPDIRTIADSLSRQVRDYLCIDNDQIGITYNGHSYFGTPGEDDYGVTLRYYLKGIDGAGVGQALPKIVFSKTNFGASTAMMIFLERIDQMAFDLFGGWSPQMSLFGNTTTTATEASTGTETGSTHTVFVDGPDGRVDGYEQAFNEPVNPSPAPAPVPAPEPLIDNKGKASKKAKPVTVAGKGKDNAKRTPFQVVQADPSDDLPTSIVQHVPAEIAGAIESTEATEATGAEGESHSEDKIAVNQ